MQDTVSPQQLRDLTLILKDFLKVIKVVSLYPETNPLPLSLRQSFAEKFCTLIEDFGLIKFTVEKERLLFAGIPVFSDKSKEEALAGMFFDAGITSLEFSRFFDGVAIYRLLDAVKTFQNSSGKGSDLVSLLWEADIAGFKFETAVDVELAEFDGELRVQGHGPTTDSQRLRQDHFGLVGVETYGQIFELPPQGIESNEVSLGDEPASATGVGTVWVSADAAPGPAPSSGSAQLADLFGCDASESARLRIADLTKAMGLENVATSVSAHKTPDTRLILNDQFKLTEEESGIIHNLLYDDARFDLYESTVELLKEMLLQEDTMQEFYETVGICEKIIGELIDAGRLKHAAHLLLYFKELDQHLRKNRPLWAERLKESVVAAGSREGLKRLAVSLNGHVDMGERELKPFLEVFGWEALAAITDLLARLEHAEHRDLVGEYLARIGSRHVDIVARGMHDRKPEVIRNSITILGKIGTSEALKQLKHALKHDDAAIRHHLVLTLAAAQPAEKLTLIAEACDDPDPVVRTSAIAALAREKTDGAFPLIATLLTSERFATLTREEKEQLYSGYSRLGGAGAVPHLRSIAMKMLLLRNAELEFQRDLAFTALAQNDSDEAERALLEMSKNWRPDIREQATQAIRKRREYRYGDRL